MSEITLLSLYQNIQRLNKNDHIILLIHFLHISSVIIGLIPLNVFIAFCGTFLCLIIT